MRRPLGLAAATALAVGSVMAFPVPADGSSPDPGTVCIPGVPETDVLEPGPVDLCVSVYKPAQASPQNRVPVLLHSHGWGGSRTSDPAAFRRYLDAGFGVVSIDQRGFGDSGGKAHVEDPAFEGRDVIAVIDHVAGLDWVKRDGPDDPVLGALGGSYGGGYQFAGAFTEIMQTGRTRFDALAPQITWHSLNESLAPNDVVRTAWTGLLYAAGMDAHTSAVHTGFSEGMVTGRWPSGMDDFFRDNGPAFHVDEGRKLDIPVLLRQGVSDNLFPLDQAIANFDRALTDRARRDSLLVGYNGGHALPNVLPAGIAEPGDTCSARLSGAGYDELELRFLTENLQGGPRTLSGHGQYHLMTARGECLTVDSVVPTAEYTLPDITTTTAAGLPQAVKIADGPLTLAGTSRLDALVTALGVDSRAFFALSVGTSPAHARVVQNNVLPHREEYATVDRRRSIELPSVAATVREGESLFLTVSPQSDLFALHGSRTPGALRLTDVTVRLPVVR
ncbi:alpha/beta hydrolase [Saccharomonospora halophila]|uniref:alpha/beta hydrolase n=1 Tax=Saccharomonospora halophila TaxID=129922 RepID=UPI00036908A0|nr:alpha/beta fold hydrolase [Saccharomonospora halophila]